METIKVNRSNYENYQGMPIESLSAMVMTKQEISSLHRILRDYELMLKEDIKYLRETNGTLSAIDETEKYITKIHNFCYMLAKCYPI